MWALNMGGRVNVPPLNEAMAIELGANLLGEFIIFSIGAGLLIFEYSRLVNRDPKPFQSYIDPTTFQSNHQGEQEKRVGAIGEDGTNQYADGDELSAGATGCPDTRNDASAG